MIVVLCGATRREKNFLCSGKPELMVLASPLCGEVWLNRFRSDDV